MPENKFDEKNAKDKLYILSMFPYPSGQLHMGHVRIYGTADVLARYFRMKGKNVLFPMGWDAFGLPAENAALERGADPNQWTQDNIANMKTVMEDLNLSFDWSREFATCDSEYFKWTQFFFIKLFERGLVYREEAFVNWDPVDMTVLADEQVDSSGRSWRSGALVEKKLLRQWFIKTTAFAKSLLNGLEDSDLKGWSDIVSIQKHWIGEISGTTIEFEIVNGVAGSGRRKIPIWMENPEYIDKAKFIAVKTNSYWTFGSERQNPLSYEVKNPLTGQVLPVYQTDSVFYPEGSDVRLGVPEIDERDKDFADSVNLKYSSLTRNPAREEELLALRAEICAEARKRGIGGHPTSSKLKDWLISRQRFWGTPIPVVYCDTCGAQTVREEDLPVRLPERVTVAKGKNALEELTEWRDTTCPKCGGEASRETDTMDTFVDSCWYYLRFLDPDNQQAAFDVKKIKSLMPVDIYVGGKEHATLHLFYARFMSHFLHSLDLVPRREPFLRLLCQGIIKATTYRSAETGEYVATHMVEQRDGKLFRANTDERLIKDWEKMSKSKNNAVEPTKLMEEHGVDLTRLLVLGASSSKSEFNWNESLSEEAFRWQRKLWLTVGNFIKVRTQNPAKPEVESPKYKELDFFMFDCRNHYLIKITSLIEESCDVGTAVRKMRGLTGNLRKCTDDIMAHSVNFERALALQIILLAPIAPCFASELWAGFVQAPNRLCLSGEILWDEPVFRQPWPQVDPNYKAFHKAPADDEKMEVSYLNKVQNERLKRKMKENEKKSKKKTKGLGVGS